MKKISIFLVVLTALLIAGMIIALAVMASRMGMVFLSNDWCTWFWQNFSTILAAVPAVAFAVLQAIAIFHPEIESNGIFTLVRKWLSKPTGIAESASAEK
jgi:phosphotransferase system  glucose/maltose/N-acetylglucosamine-specific IIC component